VALEIGIFNLKITGNNTIKSERTSLRSELIIESLNNLIFLEPLNLFLYTWRFLSQLQQEESNRVAKCLYRYIGNFIIVLLPLSFFCVVPAFIIEGSKDYFNLFHFKFDESTHYAIIAEKLQRTADGLGITANLISCLILLLVVRLIYKMTS
jgi:hypothetical protein